MKRNFAKTFLSKLAFVLSVSCLTFFFSCSLQIEDEPVMDLNFTSGEELVKFFTNAKVGKYNIVVKGALSDETFESFLDEVDTITTDSKVKITGFDLGETTGLTEIPAAAFEKKIFTTMESIILPEGITEIFAAAFRNCVSLKSMKLPSSLKHLTGLSIFAGCTSLKSVNIPQSLMAFDFFDSPFESCSALTTITVDEGNSNYFILDGALYGIHNDEAQLIHYPAAREGSTLNIPQKVEGKNVTNICGYAVMDAEKLSSVTLPDNLEVIGQCAFQNCKGLKEIQIPKDVRLVSRSFTGCENLSITVDEDNSYYKSSNGGLYDDEDNLLEWPGASGEIVLYPGKLNYADEIFAGNKKITGVTFDASDYGYYFVITQNFFKDCTNLKTVTLKESTKISIKTEIRDSAFNGCTSLETVDLVKISDAIGENAFYNCSSLKSIDLGVCDQIKDYAFYGCDLREVVIPETLTRIDMSAFGENKNLQSVTFTDTDNWVAAISALNASMHRGDTIDVTDSKVNAANLSSGDWEAMYLVK